MKTNPMLIGQKAIIRIKPTHYPLIASWYENRDSVMPAIGDLSDCGYIADGRVAGWLYFTNSNIAMIEGIISDPDTVPSLRRESVFKLVGFLSDTALALGYTTIIGITKHPGMEDVCERLGYKECDYKVLILSEEGDE